jgi:FkbM family methyltransferase
MRYLRLLLYLSNWWRYLAFKFGLTRADPLCFRTRKGIHVEVPRRLVHEFKEIFMEACYLWGLGTSVPHRPTVIDIGANAGFFSMFAASRFPGARIFSYEPVESNFKQLERNRGLNPAVEMVCINKAVYGQAGHITLSFDTRDSFTTSASVFDDHHVSNETVEMPCVTLPDIFDTHDLEHCDLLKIDCEGSEYSVLYNCPDACLNRVAQMAIEVHGGVAADENIDALEKNLNARGFKTRRYQNHMLWAWRTV